MDKKERVVYYCDGKKCCKYNQEAKSCLRSLIKDSSKSNSISLERMKCQGMCKQAPVFYIEAHDVYKKEVCKKKAEKLFKKYIA